MYTNASSQRRPTDRALATRPGPVARTGLIADLITALTAALLMALGSSAWALMPATLGLSPLLPDPPAAAAPGAAEPSAADWTSRLLAAKAAHRQLLAQPQGSAPLLAERQMASARRLVLLTALADSPPPAAAPVADPLVVDRPLLAGPPPYPVTEIDALRDQLDSLLTQQSALRLTLKSQEAAVEAAVEARRDADAKLRFARGQAPRASSVGGPDDSAALELAELRADVAELALIQGDVARQRARQAIAALAEPINQLRQEIDRGRAQQRLDDADLAKLVKGLTVESQRLAAEGAKLAERLAQRQSVAAGPNATQRREIDALGNSINLLREMEALERGKESLWRSRQEALAAGRDIDRQRAIASALAHSLDLVQGRVRSLSELDETRRAELRAQVLQVRSLPPTDPTALAEQRVLDALQTQLDVHERFRESLDRTAVLISRSRGELSLADRPDNLQDGAARLWSLLSGWATAVWRYELFSATETVNVDGRPVTLDHSVTVGKSIGLLLLMALGYWGAGQLARRLTEQMVRRFRLSLALARVVRRWVKTVLLVLVALLVLKLARIPLTAFAFMGGALAIGFGIGAQNIIKNFVSGMIVLFERQIRVGDIVSIGNTSGTVMNVDLRATTVRGFDGIDAIVPNSHLLENQISNWNGGGPAVRRNLDVGVAYGCDVRLAAQRVADCAQAHDLVQKEPAPMVLLADFGNDALLLRLQYWMHLGGPRPGTVVDSDLRFAIADALRDAGIEIAFPQRDVHLDMRGPLQVELKPPAPPATP